MKRLSLLFVLVVILISCKKEPILPDPEPEKRPLLQAEYIDDFLAKQYYYYEDTLRVMVDRRELYDPVLQRSFVDSTIWEFYYSEGLLSAVQSDNEYYRITPFEFDLQIKHHKNIQVISDISFHNYNLPNVNFIFISDPILETIIPDLDARGNVSRATNHFGENAEDSFSTLIANMYNFLGSMEYDDKRNKYSGFPAEVQMWLTWQNNPNNLIRKTLNNQVWDFAYQYHQNGLPELGQRLVSDRQSGEILSTTRYRYEYILR